MRFSLAALLCSLCLLISPPLWGAESELNLHDVLKIILQNNPDLSLARLQQRALQLDHDSLQEQLDPRYAIKGNLSDETSPTTSPFAPKGTSIGLLSGSFTQPMENGSSLTATASYTRAQSSYPSTVPKAFQSTINPTYQHQIDFIYRYPLLRGHDNRVYQEKLHQNEASTQAAQWQVAIQQEQWLAQGVRLYFQLAANDIAIQLSKDAVLRAEKLLVYQKKREHFGLIERADRLQAEALLAAREMELTNAQATRSSTLTALNRLMQHEHDEPIEPQLPNLMMPKEQQVHLLLEQAKQQRPLFHLLDAQEEASAALLAQAMESDQRQFDLLGQIGSRSLSGSALTALGQGFTLKDRYIGIGFEVSDTLSQQSHRPAIEKAELGLERVRLQRQQAIENSITEMTTALTQYQNGHMTQAAAHKREAAEQEKFLAEMRRYREGRSDTATVVQFEGDLRTAELQAALQAIQIQLAIYQLQLATGSLLKAFL